MKHFDPHLYLIADPTTCSKAVFLSTVEKAIGGGVTMVQLRCKNYESGIMNYGRKLREITKKAGIPFIVNDYVDVALVVDADGVHLGQDDMPVSMARKIFRTARKGSTLYKVDPYQNKIIGLSVQTVAQAKRAEIDGADYLGVGPIFATQSKKDAGEPIGLARLSAIVRAVSIPVVGIGGITPSNGADVIRARANGVAVISAVMNSVNPEQEARTLRSIIDKSRIK